jgi:competence protein ComEC
MKRPLWLVLPAICGGVWLESLTQSLTRLLALPDAPRSFLVAIIASYVGLLGVWGLCYRRRCLRAATCALCVLTVLIGMSRYALARYLPPHHIAHLIEDDVATIEGWLYRPVEVSSGAYGRRSIPNEFLYVAVTWFEHNGRRSRVQGKIRITLLGSDLLQAEKKSLVYGDTIRTRLRLQRPRNLPDFDYREYLRRQGIVLVGALKHDRYIAKLTDWQGNRWMAGLDAARQRIQAFFARYAAQRPAAVPALQILQAMTLGTSRELPPDIRDAFRQAGVYHLLVVSGMHVGIVTAVLHAVLSLGGVPLRYRIIGLIPALAVYAALSGFQYPVLRAALTAIVLYAAVTLNRVADAVYSLGFTAVALALLSPQALFEASFQMTMAATAAILVFYRCWSLTAWGRLAHAGPRVLRIAIASLLVSCGAMLGIAPLLIYYYRELSPYSLLSNLVASAFVAVLLPLTLLIEVLAVCAPWDVAFTLLPLAVGLADSLIWFARLFPPFSLRFPQFRPMTVWVYYLAVFGGMACFLRRQPAPSRTWDQDTQ